MHRLIAFTFVSALVLCSACSLLVAADNDGKGDGDKKEAKSDQDAIQGKWRCVKMERDGKEEENEAKEPAPTLTFEGDAVTLRHPRDNGETDTKHATFKLDSEKKPHQITVTPKDEADRDRHMVGLYELKGDTLKVAFRHGEQADTPPDDFKGGDGISIMTLEREKKSDAGKDGKDEKK
jgi:uncharacterized protein (TIGR03067 family)